MLLTVIVLTITIALWLFVFLWISWIIHLEMMKGYKECIKREWCSYREFKKRFDKIKVKEWDWEYTKIWKFSLFKYHPNSSIPLHYYHADIIVIDNVGLKIRNPIDFFLVKRYVAKYIKENFPQLKDK